MFAIKVIIPEKPAIEPSALQAAVDVGMNQAAEEIQAEFESTIETWNAKPKFVIEFKPDMRFIYTVNQIYTWVNDGTEPHEILPIRTQALRFYTGGFVPKTGVGSLGSRPGAQGAETVFAVHLDHPGIMAHEFDRVIWERWLEILPVRIQAVIDKAGL